ncbi:MAG: hypothetical protein IKN20_04435, partial [Firmicutes bacterium]|nr:hypothetical protein [Bacillota bacterium]
TDLDKDLSLLQSYSRGSGSDLKSALRALSTDAAALRDSLGDFTETLALLDLQIGGKDITVQGIPSQELDAQSKKAKAVLDLYDAASAIAPINNADMFMVAANAMASGITPAESAAALQQQKEQLSQAVTAVIMGSQGAIPDEASALAYIQANAASDPAFAAIAAALQKQTFLQTLYAQTATGKDGLMTEEDFMTALLMAQDQTLSGQSAYRASVQKSFALMDAMQNGLMANLASLCDSLSKGTRSAADLIGNTNGNLSKRTKDALDDFDSVMTRTENLLTKTGELLKNLEAAGKTAEDAVPDLKADLTDAQTLLTDLNKTAADTTGLLRSFEGTMKNAGVKLDEGTKKTLEGLSVTLRKLADSTDTTGGVRAAKNGVSDIVEDVWNDYTGKLNNLLLMDPSAPAQSLTDSRNDAPQTIQVMLRTQEIKVEAPEAETDSPEAAPQEPGSDSVWDRILELFSGIKDDVAGLFHRDAEEAAEL